MRFSTVKVDAVARVQHHHFLFDGNFELSLYHIIIFLSIVSVFVWLLVAWQRIHLYHERIYLSVLEPYGKALVFILVVAVYLRSLSLAGYVISLHARFFAEEQYVEIDAVKVD